MAFTPNSKVYLLDTPLDNNYKNTLHFTNITTQFNYFQSCIKHSFEGVTYQRKDSIMRVASHIDSLWDVNYMMYQNTNFTNRWFYAFITKMVYVNDRATDIYIDTDVYQTWLFDCTLKPSFVVREHVADDTIGANLVDEQLEYGDYKMESYLPVNKMGSNWNIVAVSDTAPLGNNAQVGNVYGNVATGLTYYPFPNTSQGIEWLKEFIKKYDQAGKPDAIVMIFTVPQLVIPTVDSPAWLLGDPITSGEPYGFTQFSTTKKVANIDGYTPKNNKLFTYPYKFFYMSNNNGQSAIYRYEDFNTPDDPNTLKFYLFGSVFPNPIIMIVPDHYKGEGSKYEYGLSLTGFPLCSWSSDTYTAWFAQHGAGVAVALAGSTTALIGGVLTANPIAIGGGALGVFSQMAQIQKASVQPDQAKGQAGSGSLHFAGNSLDFYYAHMAIKQEFAKKIDDYLTMFGYKVNKLKVPETRSRLNWNYIQTIDMNIDGAIPDDDMARLKKVYNEGITLWHNPSNFLNYNVSNNIR